MKKPLKIAIAVAAGLLVVLQFVPVDRSNPPVTAAMPLPEGEVGEVLQASCYDCHSNETTWPWYSYVAPVSFFVADHVAEGREHVNFSTWGREDAEEQDHILEEVVEVMEEGEMPLRSYTIAHPAARLTDAQRRLLVDWARQRRAELGGGDDRREGEGR